MGGQLVIGNLFGLLTQMCIPGPEDVGVDLLLLADLLAPLATAIGMWREKNCKKKKNSREICIFDFTSFFS